MKSLFFLNFNNEIMGCVFSCKEQKNEENVLRLNDNLLIEIISSSLQLINYFKDKNDNLPKCIFIFGGSGSNKGELIYEMVCASWNNYKNEQTYLEQQDNLKKKLFKEQNLIRSQLEKNKLSKFKNELSISQNINSKDDSLVNNLEKNSLLVNNQLNNPYFWNSNSQVGNVSNASMNNDGMLNFVYSYIDVEKLILQNLKKRIEEMNEFSYQKSIKDLVLIEDKNIIVEEEKNILDQTENKVSKADLLEKEAEETLLDEALMNNLMKNKVSFKNKNWIEFLQVCQEEFELNQSIIKTNLNHKKLKEYFFDCSNLITNNWVFNLIENEIHKRNKIFKKKFLNLVNQKHDFESKSKFSIVKDKNYLVLNDELIAIPEIVYIINIIPNQINLFKDCLFLKQKPNLANFKINYIGINLVSGDLQKKDLDSVLSHYTQDETNFNYISYFRSINRLTDVQIRNFKQKTKLRIVKGKNSIKLSNESDIDFLFGAIEENLKIDLSNFKLKNQSFLKEIKTIKYNLLFFVDNQIDIGDLLLCIEDQSINMLTLRVFIQTYFVKKKKISYSRNFDC